MIEFPDDPIGRELVLMVERAKYERFVQRETTSLIIREFDRIVDTITSSKWRTLTQFQKQRALQLFRELERQIRSGYNGVSDFHVREMKGYATFENEVARAQAASILPTGSKQLQQVLGAFLPRHTLESIGALPIQGLKIGEWFEAQATTMSRETRRIIQQGLIEGKGPAEITRKILAGQTVEGPVLSRRAVNEAIAISRTTVNAVQNHAAVKSYDAMPESVSNSFRYVAIRDHRTSAICRALDSRVFRNDDPQKKVPPQHINCRSSVVPIVFDANGKVIELSKAPHTFASYSDWLKAQNVATQNSILGPSRADLWRSGRMSLADAIDQDNRVLTLPELRAKLEAREKAA